MSGQMPSFAYRTEVHSDTATTMSRVGKTHADRFGFRLISFLFFAPSPHLIPLLIACNRSHLLIAVAFPYHEEHPHVGSTFELIRPMLRDFG